MLSKSQQQGQSFEKYLKSFFEGEFCQDFDQKFNINDEKLALQFDISNQMIDQYIDFQQKLTQQQQKLKCILQFAHIKSKETIYYNDMDMEVKSAKDAAYARFKTFYTYEDESGMRHDLNGFNSAKKVLKQLEEHYKSLITTYNLFQQPQNDQNDELQQYLPDFKLPPGLYPFQVAVKADLATLFSKFLSQLKPPDLENNDNTKNKDDLSWLMKQFETGSEASLNNLLKDKLSVGIDTENLVFSLIQSQCIFNNNILTVDLDINQLFINILSNNQKQLIYIPRFEFCSQNYVSQCSHRGLQIDLNDMKWWYNLQDQPIELKNMLIQLLSNIPLSQNYSYFIQNDASIFEQLSNKIQCQYLSFRIENLLLQKYLAKLKTFQQQNNEEEYLEPVSMYNINPDNEQFFNCQNQELSSYNIYNDEWEQINQIIDE